jgi:hypothetical protein
MPSIPPFLSSFPSSTHPPTMTSPQEIFKSLATIPSYSGATILPNSTDNVLSKKHN